MKLILKNNIIAAPIEIILNRLRQESKYGYLDVVGTEHNNNIKVTCPFHKDGHESKPSCYVFCDMNDPKLEYGFYRCFTCGAGGPLYNLVSKCLGCSQDNAKSWLVENFGAIFDDENFMLPDFLEEPKKVQYISEEELQKYNISHPYVWKRKISKYIADLFHVGYDKELDAITFPVWDLKDNIVMVTKRSVNSKRFYIPEGIEKPVYLLNYIQKWNITEVWVAESQINALYAWTLGYPCIALLGTGSKTQLEILASSGIRNYHLCFDGDNAGDRGAEKFVKSMPPGISIDKVLIPRGKDINDLSAEEFQNLKRIYCK